MALLAIQNISGTGLPSFVAAAGGGDTVPAISGRGGGWDLGLLLVVRNLAIGATRTVTIEGVTAVIVPAAVNGVDPAPDTPGIAVIPIPGKHFGNVRTITYSAVTDLAVAVVRIV